jgi:hypothetical protein
VSAVRQQLISTVTAEMVGESPKMRAGKERASAAIPCLCSLYTSRSLVVILDWPTLVDEKGAQRPI